MKPDEAMVNLEVARYGLRTFREMREGYADVPIEFATWITAVMPGNGDSQLVTRVLGPVYVTSDKEWLDGTCEAKCMKNCLPNRSILSILNGPYREHKSPDEDCNCGVYAALTLQHLEWQYPQFTKRIVTVIAAEGQTIIGDRGFRTERAEVVGYWCRPDLLELCRKQFVEAQHFFNKYEMLRAFHLESGQPEWAPLWQKVVGGVL